MNKRNLFFGLFFYVVIFIFPGLRAVAQPKIIKTVYYSLNVKDSFDLTVLLPQNYTPEKIYNTVYFLDAGIKSGSHIIKLLKEHKNASNGKNTIFIGIGHKGNFHVLRRRDFLPPVIKNGILQKSTEKDYGHANLFYLFLQKELIPAIEKKYLVNTKRSIIGHSFGGLFVYYCLFKDEKLFTNHFALSPSLWVNSSNLFEYEKIYFSKHKNLKANLYMANGSLEFANYVLPSNRRMNVLLKKRKYTGLQFTYHEKQFANHNSHVPLTLQEILDLLKEKE